MTKKNNQRGKEGKKRVPKIRWLQNLLAQWRKDARKGNIALDARPVLVTGGRAWPSEGKGEKDELSTVDRGRLAVKGASAVRRKEGADSKKKKTFHQQKSPASETRGEGNEAGNAQKKNN